VQNNHKSFSETLLLTRTRVDVSLCAFVLYRAHCKRQFTSFPTEQPTQLAGQMETVRHRRGAACRMLVMSAICALNVLIFCCSSV